MAAEVVICKNLARIFVQNAQLIRKFHPLDNWEDSVEKAESVMAALIENNDLGGLLYKADDLLDEILTFINGRTGFRAARQESDRGVKQTIENATCRITKEVNLFFSSHNQLVFPLTRKTRQLARTSQKIKACAEQLLNVVATIDHRESDFEAPQNVRLSENRVLGRDVDKGKIIAMLLRPEKHDTNVSVMHIVGIPGVGKSNIAKYVFDDEEIDNHFDLKIWIRVSTISDEEIVRQIVESSTNRRFNDDLNSRLGKSGFGDRLGCRSLGSSVISPSEIRTRKDEVNKIFKRRLRKEIKGKLFLLVLDDASIRPWEPLKELLAGGARGSHILVTPQSVEDSVAVSSQPYQLNSLESRHISVTTEPVEENVYHLNGLEKEASWSLFQTFAFGQEGATPSEFEEIGKSIAENCEGIPLTIKVAASLLHGKSAEYWQSVKDSMLRAQHQGTSIMNQVLNLSYNNLPTRLKACFGYCSLFPEDYNFNKHNLISLWIAQGYVDGQNLEKTAETYFLHLLRRCFFEYVSTDDLGNIVTCKMHRIMRTLACQHAPGVLNSYMVDSSVNEKIPSKHISFICVENSSTKIAPDLLKTRSLRTLLSVKEPHCNTTMDKSVSDTLIASFKCLRVLDLHDLGIQELPVSIGKLIHLRYLDLSKNGLLTLPKSLTELYNLHAYWFRETNSASDTESVYSPQAMFLGTQNSE